MSLIIDPDNEDFEDLGEIEYEPYFIDEEEFEDEPSKKDEDSLMKLEKWVYIYNLNDYRKKTTCNIILPNPSYLGLEKTYEICRFLISEIETIVTQNQNIKSNLSSYKAFKSCQFILEDFIHNRLKM